MSKYYYRIFLLLSLIFLSSCAVFWDKEIEAANNEEKLFKIHNLNLVFISTYYGRHETYVHNISEVYIDKKWTLNGGQSAIWQVESYVDSVIDELRKSNHFQKLQVVYSKSSDKNQYTLELDQIANQEKASGAKNIWKFGSAVTLGIIPMWETRTVKLKVTLFKGQDVVKTYVLSEDFDYYFSILLLPLSPFYLPKYREASIVKYLINTAIIDFKKDNII